MARVAVTARQPVREMSDEHKAALALGREQTRIVREYLQSLTENRPKRGRKRTLETVVRRIEQINEELDEGVDALRRLRLAQERMDLEQERERMEEGLSAAEQQELEDRFIDVAAEFSDRKGVSYSAWREAGVPAPVLKAAGIAQTRTRS